MVIDSMPKISALIISYNFERYLRESIESVLTQTLRPLEIIICDDCSTDKSWTIINEYARQYPDLIKSYRQERNIGPFGNGSFAFNKAEGNLLSSIDGDDCWLPRKLELEWKALQRYPDARIAYSNVYTIDPEGNRTGIWYNGQGPVPPSGDVFLKVASRRFFPNISSVFRNELTYRSVYDEIIYDKNVKIFLDYDFKLRATARYPVAYSGEALVEYRIHDGGIHNSPPENLDRDQLYVYKKNLPLLDSRPEQEAIEIKRQWSSFEQHVKNADNIITCICPYCKETLNISHEGNWQCPCCKRDFSFYNNQTPKARRIDSGLGGKKLTESNISECQASFNLTYHVPYAHTCQRLVGFEGKDVLEVGGSLPKDFVFDYLNVKSWSAVESPDYDDFTKEVGRFSRQSRLGGSIHNNMDDHSGLGFNDMDRNLGEYNLFLANIEDLPPEYHEKYDLIFSIACFEHIHKFPLALEKMFLALKPKGQLFTMFSPIWSAHNGHHLPKITDSKGSTFGFQDSPIPPWGHLLMRPPELCEYLCGFTDKETSDLITYYVYNSNHINRFFTEDYIAFINQTQFEVEKIEFTFLSGIDKQTQDTLERNYPGRIHFANNGILAILKRP